MWVLWITFLGCAIAHKCENVLFVLKENSLKEEVRSFVSGTTSSLYDFVFETTLNIKDWNVVFEKTTWINPLAFAASLAQESKEDTFVVFFGDDFHVEGGLALSNESIFKIKNSEDSIACFKEISDSKRLACLKQKGILKFKTLNGMNRYSHDFLVEEFIKNPDFSLPEFRDSYLPLLLHKQISFGNIQSSEEMESLYKPAVEAVKIPEKLHQIWIGDKYSQTVARCHDSCKNVNYEWEKVFWNETMIRHEFGNAFYDHFKSERDSNSRLYLTDITRLGIIYRHGGIYMDADVFCLKPLRNFFQDERLHVEPSNLTMSFESEEHCADLIENNIIIAPAKNASIRSLLLFYFLEQRFTENPAWIRTGPLFVTNSQKKYPDLVKIDVIPSKYFLPFHFLEESSRKMHLADMISSERAKDSYGIHIFNSTLQIADEIQEPQSCIFYGASLIASVFVLLVLLYLIKYFKSKLAKRNMGYTHPESVA